MKLLDLFCGAGGASLGYHQAGFSELTGIDIFKVHYPFKFIQRDWLNVTEEMVNSVDFVHASPPCQGYSRWTTHPEYTPQYIGPVRELISSKPYVIENVQHARPFMRDPILLCGTMFGLPFSRHRLFESNVPMTPPEHPKCMGVAANFARSKGWDIRDMRLTGNGRTAGIAVKWREAMGLTDAHYMPIRELKEVVPPAYTKWLGEQVLNYIDKSAKTA